MPHYHRSLTIAEGSAYATAKDMSVEEFLNRGAAIAVQVKQTGATMWNNDAHILSFKEV